MKMMMLGLVVMLAGILASMANQPLLAALGHPELSGLVQAVTLAFQIAGAAMTVRGFMQMK